MTKRAAIYVRVSKNREDDAAKPERQVESCMHLAKAKGLEVVPCSDDQLAFTDDDVSAYQAKAKRPAYEALMKRVRAGEFDVVLVWHVDRLLRTTTEMLTFIDLARATGVSLEGVQAGALDLATPVGKMVAVILSAVAEQEVEIKAERHKLKNEQARAEGKSTGGPVPFGWRLGERTVLGRTFVVHDLEALQIANATRHVIEGTSTLNGIATEWNALGSTTTISKPWTHTAVKKVLMRPRNAGLMDHKGEVLEGVEAAHEPVVTREQWQACRDILSSRSRPRAARKHVLSSLIRCAKCGNPLTAGVTVLKVKGVRYSYPVYKHFSRDKGCGVTIRQELTEHSVGRRVKHLLYTQSIEQIAPTSLELTKAAELRHESATIEIRMRDLEQMWRDGDYSTDGYKKDRSELRERLEGVSKSLADIERANAFAGLLRASAGAPSFMDAAAVGIKFDSLPFEHKRVIVSTLFPRIEILPGRGVDRIRTYRSDGGEFALDPNDECELLL